MRSKTARIAPLAVAAAALAVEAMATIAASHARSRRPRRPTSSPPGDGPEDHPDNTFGLPEGKRLVGPILNVFRRQLAKVLGTLADVGAPIPDRFPDLADYDDPFASAMTPLIGAYWDRAGKLTRARLGLDPGSWQVVDPRLHAAIAAQSLKFCSKTNATTGKRLDEALAELREQLAAGLVAKGEAVPALRDRVRSIFSGLTSEHAEMIARTEASRAVHAAAILSAEGSGAVESKRWLASANSCDACRERERATRDAPVPLAAAFAEVGGDPAYSTVVAPPLHPYCRCTFVFDLAPEYRDLVASEGGSAPAAVAPVDPRTPGVRRPRDPAKPPAFPPDPEALAVVRPLGGSTGAELVRDRWGRRWVRKRGASPDHLREEALADDAYRALGVAVPRGRLYEGRTGPVKLSEYIEGVPLGSLPDDARRAAERRLGEHFAADALLGNRDVVGESADNVIVDPAGKPWRVDNGGALRFRARGSPKGAAGWDDYPTEIWTLRDAAANPRAAAAFGRLTIAEVADQVGRIGLDGRAMGLPPEVARVVDSRLAEMRHATGAAMALVADKFKDRYADSFARHTMGIRKAGIVSRMPTSLKRKGNRGTKVFDQDGVAWDHLRGEGSLVGELHRYVAEAGGSPGLLRAWAGAQAKNSWSPAAAGMKDFLAGERSMGRDDFWWKEDVDAGRCYAALEKEFGPREAIRSSAAAQHAFTHELLSRCDFSSKDAPAGTVRLIRTENKKVMADAGIAPGATGAILKRGVAESTSVYQPVKVNGTERTTQSVPLHRVLGTYWQGRYNGHGDGLYLKDSENEFLAILDGVPLDYEAAP